VQTGPVIDAARWERAALGGSGAERKHKSPRNLGAGDGAASPTCCTPS